MLDLRSNLGFKPEISGVRLKIETQDALRRPWPRLARSKAHILKTTLPVGIFIGITLFVLLILSHQEATYLTRGSTAERTLSKTQLEGLQPPSHDDGGGPRHLRLFMPADGPHINLCKTIMSTVALGYPMPTILNWNGEFNRPDWHFAGSHVAKLESLLAVIDTIYDTEDNVNENDLILLVDAYDIWFQLPPSVLVERFHTLNRNADVRVAEQWAELAAEPGFPVRPPRQNIIVTTAKDCQPTWESGSNPRYEYWPESPLPSDFYGAGTDEIPPYAYDAAQKYKKVRPRCVNSGMVMGTMGALRGALGQAKAKVDDAAMRGRQLWSDQALFAEVIGDQEMWRYWVRGLASEWNGSESREVLRRLPKEVRNIADNALAGEKFEFGIGLDYDFATIPPICSSEDEGFFVQLDDQDALQRESEKAGVADVVRVKGIPPELKDAEGPIPGVGWGNLSLYTDFFFGTTPVGIHHNAYIFGLKPWRLEHWWNMTWYYPHLRDLIGNALRKDNKLTPLVSLPMPGDNETQIVYWASEGNGSRKEVSVFSGADEERKFAPIDWDGLCQKGEAKWCDTLFGDDKGNMT
ncbi:hypothetical protein CTRI78_v010995 [Colletotrichum trifolii]|uniref:Uncharacterized protein n=1 Tax=Colletotrichum trifolii TaxID=5466 RepID=A0A4R8QGH8_COLTR|nr:hypothetical protein CTRI78_v010995 [Colletotrichum trifolii]